MPIIGKNSKSSYLKEIEKRFKKTEKERAKNLRILSKNKAKDILKLNTEERIRNRKSLIPPGENVTLEGIVTGSQLMPVNYLARGQTASKPVCRIEVKNVEGFTKKYGTGFMVSQSLLLTNQHVLQVKEDCIRTLAEFNYEEDKNFLPLAYSSFQLDPDLFWYNYQPLDFALVGVRQKDVADKIQLSDFGYLKLIRKPKGLVGEYATLIHHPNKEKKQISIRENRIVKILDPEPFIQYESDSLGGSSGAPVFSDNWDVIALHHGGIEKKDSHQRTLDLNGGIWDGVDEDKKQFESNEGIRISKIIEHLDALNNLNKFQGKSKEVLEDFLKLSTND